VALLATALPALVQAQAKPTSSSSWVRRRLVHIAPITRA